MISKEFCEQFRRLGADIETSDDVEWLNSFERCTLKHVHMLDINALGLIASFRASALINRLDGNIDLAMKLEEVSDRIYNRLDRRLQW